MKSHTITIIILALTLGACSSDDDATSSTSSSPATSIGDSDESSDGESSSSGDLDDESSSEGEASSSSTGDDVPACDPVPLPDGTTCCCDPDHPAPDCPAGTEACGGASTCEGARPALEHDACGSTCDGHCAAAYQCRGNYAGGYLAECERSCELDTDCTVAGDVCSAGWCVTPCGPAGECAEGTFCYPPAGVTNDDHPVPHCMAMREGT